MKTEQFFANQIGPPYFPVIYSKKIIILSTTTQMYIFCKMEAQVQTKN